MQTPAKDDASEEKDEGDDAGEIRHASMMKKMTPPASEAGACDEEEPKEEQEEQVDAKYSGCSSARAKSSSLMSSQDG